ARSAGRRRALEGGPLSRRWAALVREPPELVAEAVVEARALELGQENLVVVEANLELGPRLESADGTAIGGHVDGVRLGLVRHRQRVGRRDDERPRRERVRRDERDDEPLDPPGE